MAFPPPSEYWRGQRKALRQLLWGVSPEGSVGTALVQALRQPLSHHVQQYVVLLLSLGDSLGEVGGRVGRRRAVAQGVRLTQAPWFEKDRAGLGGHALFWGARRGIVLPWGVCGTWPCPDGADRDPASRRGIIHGCEDTGPAGGVTGWS